MVNEVICNRTKLRCRIRDASGETLHDMVRSARTAGVDFTFVPPAAGTYAVMITAYPATTAATAAGAHAAKAAGLEEPIHVGGSPLILVAEDKSSKKGRGGRVVDELRALLVEPGEAPALLQGDEAAGSAGPGSPAAITDEDVTFGGRLRREALQAQLDMLPLVVPEAADGLTWPGVDHLSGAGSLPYAVAYGLFPPDAVTVGANVIRSLASCWLGGAPDFVSPDDALSLRELASRQADAAADWGDHVDTVSSGLRGGYVMLRAIVEVLAVQVWIVSATRSDKCVLRMQPLDKPLRRAQPILLAHLGQSFYLPLSSSTT